MSFWSSEKITDTQQDYALITPFDLRLLKHGAYELTLGHQGAISDDGENILTTLNNKGQFKIPRGQFGLLISDEIVQVPHDAMGFISFKTKIKSWGLINVSGFHVDPGYHGRLKFWVYNAGNNDVSILQGDATFLIWFASLDRITKDLYKNNPEKHNEITADDINRLRGHLASPAELLKQFEKLEKGIQGKVESLDGEISLKLEALEHKYERLHSTTTFLLGLVAALIIALMQPLINNLLTKLLEAFYPP